MDDVGAAQPATVAGRLDYVQWPSVVAGAVTGAATAFVLMGFAAALGLAIVSPSPTWRDASSWLALLSGVWVLLVQVLSFGLAGYVAGRMRMRLVGLHSDEVEFRDGMHGVLAWALGILIGALMLWAAASTATSFSSPSTGARAESRSAPAFLAFELDRLFRSNRTASEGIDASTREEAGRIVLSDLGRREIAADDRAYLTNLVAARTGLGPVEAGQRVNQVLEGARQAAAKARRSSVIIGFFTAAALAAAAAAAWLAGIAGGRHRDAETPPRSLASWRWGA